MSITLNDEQAAALSSLGKAMNDLAQARCDTNDWGPVDSWLGVESGDEGVGNLACWEAGFAAAIRRVMTLADDPNELESVLRSASELRESAESLSEFWWDDSE